MAYGDDQGSGALSVIELSGLDLRNGSFSAPRGSMRDMLNYEVDQEGGVVGSKGWAKYDGTVMGPDLENCVVIGYLPGSIAGVFQYGENVRVTAPGLPVQNLLCLGTASVGFGNFIALAYPYSDYTDWVDPTSFGLATTLFGMTSGATISAILYSRVMNDESISVSQYNAIRKSIAAKHSASVLPVPGDALRPVDAVFTFNNDVYAIHDCIVIAFSNGSGTTPLEGHWLRNQTGNVTLGRILSVNIVLAGGSFDSSNAAGYVILYDCPIPFPTPGNTDRLDLYNATNTVLVSASVMRYAAVTVPANLTRAILYKTTDQTPKTNSFLQPPGQYLPQPPGRVQTNPRTWGRPQCTREMPYIQKYGTATAGVGFAPAGANDFSIYEYTRAGITPKLTALTPITAAEKFPTVATQPAAAWVNPNNLFADDGVFTTNPGNAQYIRGSGFDFSFIPPGSRILGLSVRVKGLASAANVAYFQNVQLTIPDPNQTNGWRLGVQNKGGNIPAATLTAANSSFTFGSNGDLWGEQITPQVLQDPNFGVYLSIARNGIATYSLDCLTVTITYVPPSRQVFIRNTGSNPVAVTDIPVNILHYSLDQGSFTDAGNPAKGVLSFWVMLKPGLAAIATEADATNAGMPRVIGAGEEIWTGPGATGSLLGYTSGGHSPISFPGGALLDQFQSTYEAIDANFYDDVNARAAFIANGVEFATMFDGQYTIRIRTGRPTDQDNPRHVANHLGYLHLGFASGAVVNCGTNRPLSVIGAPGSNTYNFGEPITGLKTLNGQTLGVWTDRCTRGLQGASPAPSLGGYTALIISPSIGCIEYSLASVMGEAVWMSYRGVETVQTIVAYGDFQTVELSQKATPWLRDRIQVDRKISTTPSRLVGAIGCRNKRQYRAYFEDGYVFTLTMFGTDKEPECSIQCLGRPVAAATFPDDGVQTYLRAVVRNVAQGVRTDGKELIFATFENLSPVVIGPPLYNFPYVVQFEIGGTWDVGLDMPRWVDLNALYFGDPQQLVKFQSVSLLVNALQGTQLRAYVLTNFDGPMNIGPTITNDPNVYVRQIQLPRYPAASDVAYLPAPQVAAIIDTPATGRMMRLRIDANQTADSDVTTLPVRITHLAIQLEPEMVTRS